MAMKFTTTSEAAKVNGVKVLTYAESGIGKTVLTATAPAPVLISAESGLLSLAPKNIERVFGVNFPGVTYNVPVIEVETVDDLRDAYNWCASSTEAAQFATVGLDSISEIGEVILNNAKRTAKDPRQAYGELIEQMETLVRLFRDLPGKNVYMSAKLEPAKDELTGIIRYGPSLPGSKLGPKLPYFFDEVFRLGVNKDNEGNNFRFLQTQPDLQYVAKDRSGALDTMESPFLANVFNKILGG